MDKLRAVYSILFICLGLLKAQAQTQFVSDYQDDVACTPYTVQFAIDTTTVDIDTITTVTWKFGEDPTDSLVSAPADVVSYTYIVADTFTVTMDVDNGTAVDIRTDYIKLQRKVPPTFRWEEFAPLRYRIIPTGDIVDIASEYIYDWTIDEPEGNAPIFIPTKIVQGGDETSAIDTIDVEPGDYEISLHITRRGGKYCESGSAQTLSIPAPLSSDTARFFTVDTNAGCTPLAITFSIKESALDVDTVESIRWDFGLSRSVKTLLEEDTTLVYEQGGRYSISVEIESVNGWEETEELTDFIHAYQTVSAAFDVDEFEEDYVFRMVPLDTLPNDSTERNFLWTYIPLDDSTQVFASNAYYVSYSNQLSTVDTLQLELGNYMASLVVTDTINGCISSYAKLVRVHEDIIVPNLFTTGEGQLFIVDPQNLETVLHMEIFNRYGMPVFSQTAPQISWDGRVSNGTYVNSGVYFYTLEATQGDPLDKIVQQGFIHIYN